MIRRITATCVILLFFVHPTISEYVFNAFKCESFDGESRLYKDLEILCYKSEHMKFIYIGIPALLFWGNDLLYIIILVLGIPATALSIMIKNKNLLMTPNMKEQLGFLYNGYRSASFYWEILIMYRKIMIVFISVFLSSVGTSV